VGIGGATYARTMERCVAFGPIFPDEESRIHTADEYIDIRNLYLMTDIYYEALKSLL
jgi:succinyl-diaminopimelate desuccinylase